MSVETDVNVLKKQVLHFLTRAQITALIDALGTDHTTLTTAINSLAADVALILAEIQSMKDTIDDHENRITTLE